MNYDEIIDKVIEVFSLHYAGAVDTEDFLDELGFTTEELDSISDELNDMFDTNMDIEAEEFMTVADIINYLNECQE